MVNNLPTGSAAGVALGVAEKGDGREKSKPIEETSPQVDGYTVPTELLAGQELRAIEDDSTGSEESAPGRIRTSDHPFRKQVLYPLSYEGLQAFSAGRRDVVRRSSQNLGRWLRIPVDPKHHHDIREPRPSRHHLNGHSLLPQERGAGGAGRSSASATAPAC